MGNFSRGQHATLVASRDGLELHYVVDLAEMPTFNLRAEIGLAAGDALTPAHVEGYRERVAAEWLGKLTVTLDSKKVPLAPALGRSTLEPGAGGLPTARFVIDALSGWPAGTGKGPHDLFYRDDNFPDVAGWKEVVVRTGPGARLLTSTVSVTDRSAGLTKYPAEGEMAPLAVREARAQVRFDDARPDPRVAPAAPQSQVPVGLLAVVVAVLLVAGGLAAARRS